MLSSWLLGVEDSMLEQELQSKTPTVDSPLATPAQGPSRCGAQFVPLEVFSWPCPREIKLGVTSPQGGTIEFKATLAIPGVCDEMSNTRGWIADGPISEVHGKGISSSGDLDSSELLVLHNCIEFPGMEERVFIRLSNKER